MLHVAADARSKAATGICVFQVSPTKKQPSVDRTGREERSERAWRAAPSAVLDPAPSAVVRQLSISAVLRHGVGDAPTRPLRAANASAEPAYRHPGESARAPSAVAAGLRTTPSSAIATPLPTRPPTGDDDADDADDADEAGARTIREQERASFARCCEIRETSRPTPSLQFHAGARSTEAFPSHSPLLAPRLFQGNDEKYTIPHSSLATRF